jgi:recombinational DNA repair protein RecR
MSESIIQCNFCGDSCGESVCYSCEDTAYDMGVDLNEVMF